MSATVLL